MAERIVVLNNCCAIIALKTHYHCDVTSMIFACILFKAKFLTSKKQNNELL